MRYGWVKGYAGLFKGLEQRTDASLVLAECCDEKSLRSLNSHSSGGSPAASASRFLEEGPICSQKSHDETHICHFSLYTAAFIEPVPVPISGVAMT